MVLGENGLWGTKVNDQHGRMLFKLIAGLAFPMAMFLACGAWWFHRDTSRAGRR
jgi:hypothetical protein